MKLQNSKLCVNCESLYDGVNSCPYCRSEVFVWLSRALGTTIEPETEQNDYCTLASRRDSVSRAHVHLPGSPANLFGDAILKNKSLPDFRFAIQRWGREMVRVLTFGMM